jgi:DHA2 family multidrug resistance protein
MPNIEEKPLDFRTWVGVLGTMLGAFMAVLDTQITNSSLKDITGGIAATQVEGSWVSTSYLIGEIITIPLTMSRSTPGRAVHGGRRARSVSKGC